MTNAILGAAFISSYDVAGYRKAVEMRPFANADLLFCPPWALRRITPHYGHKQRLGVHPTMINQWKRALLNGTSVSLKAMVARRR